MGQLKIGPVETYLTDSPVAVAVADAQSDDTPLLFVNPAFCDMTGYRTDQVVGRNCRFLQGEHDNKDARKAIRSALANGESTRVILKNITRDGFLFDNLLFIEPLFDDNGQPCFYVGSQFALQPAQAERRMDVHLKILDQTIAHLSAINGNLFNQQRSVLAQSARSVLGYWLNNQAR